MAQLAVLPLSEEIIIDQDELARIYIQLEEKADDLIAASLEELAYRIPHAHQLFLKSETDKLRQCAFSISKIATQLSMSALANVATHVTHCCENADQVALAATHSRMIRLGEGSLREIWNLQDLPI